MMFHSEVPFGKNKKGSLTHEELGCPQYRLALFVGGSASLIKGITYDPAPICLFGNQSFEKR
jgi:hypothetical protein